MQLSQLSQIVTVPDGATSFHTEQGKIVFLIGASGTFSEAELTEEQVQQLRDVGALGTFGQPIEA